MTERETPQDKDQTTHRRDDRRGDVKPTDNPVPSSPEPEEDSLRAGEEKLERLKPY